ncbi:MAG: ornithine cyclodeaminase family protein [Betaproteobacteria bacterium]|nr:MAG: ornithine cyclodeaminase family protein [Betaproteobacteria bacterium]
MRYIDEAAIERVLRMEELIPAMRRAMIDFSQGRVEQPARRMLEVPPHAGFFGSMPAASHAALGAKLVTFYPRNAERALHTHHAVIVLFRPDSGEPLVVMDARLITELRTAAVLGAGTQGRSHIAALSCIRRFDEIRIWNRTPERAQSLAEDVGALAVASREDAVRGADVVVVATSSAEPVLEGRWLKPGAKVATVGWSGRDGCEVDAQAMSNVVIVDSREGALTESGNVLRSRASIYAELGEVLSGSAPIAPNATVVFDSIGMACQDIAAGWLVCERLGIG